MTSDTEWPLQSGAGSTGFGATVWIVGAKGFLGRHIARRFGAAGSASIGRSLDEPFADFFDTAASTAQILAFLCQRAQDTPLVLSSSAAVYGTHGPGPIPETCPLAPVSPYGSHKRYAEELCLL